VQKPKVLVTGARGFIGSHLVDYLIEKGYRVRATATARSSGAYLNPKAEFIEADLTKFSEVWPLFCQELEIIFHPAGIYNHSLPREILDRVNVGGTKNLLEVALNFPKIKKILIWSTAGFYDSKKYPHLIFGEEDPVNPERNNYTASKYAQERLALDFARKYSLPITILRPPTVYGPRSYYGFSLLIIRAVQGRLYLIPQTGKRLCFSTCQVLDVCRAAEFLARIAETTAKIYNICDDSRYLLKEIFYFVSSQTKNKIYGQIPLWLISFLANFLPIEKAEIDYLYYPYLMSNQKIKNLGFKLFYPDLKTGLKETIQWYLKRPS